MVNETLIRVVLKSIKRVNGDIPVADRPAFIEAVNAQILEAFSSEDYAFVLLGLEGGGVSGRGIYL